MNLSAHFAQRAFQHQDKDNNWIYSPYSITVALGISYLGTAGKTRTELESTLQISEERLPPVLPEAEQETILSANRLFISDICTPENDFSIAVEARFQSHPQLLWMKIPERAAAVINHWVSEETQENIRTVIRPADIDPTHTRLILIAALYFSGQWRTPFEVERTKDAIFYKNGTEAQPVQMMTRTDSLQSQLLEDCQLVALPYRADVSLFIVLPNASEGWRAIQPEDWERNFEHLQSLPAKKTKISLPRFSIDTADDISGLLQKMGIVSAFSSQEADFSRITEEESLQIDTVRHQAHLSIDENGTEAAAATAVVIARPRSVGLRAEPPLVITIDHPFFFVLRHNQTKEWLFVGQYLGV